jgi:hypothetical protein
MGNVSKSDELISVTAFGKYILNPMNEVTISSSSNDILHKYWRLWYVVGAEVEYRKQLLIPILTTLKLSAGLNASYLYSNQELNADVNRETVFQVDFTKQKENSLASDLLLNADLTFFNEWNDKNNNLTTTIAYVLFRSSERHWNK